MSTDRGRRLDSLDAAHAPSGTLAVMAIEPARFTRDLSPLPVKAFGVRRTASAAIAYSTFKKHARWGPNRTTHVKPSEFRTAGFRAIFNIGRRSVSLPIPAAIHITLHDAPVQWQQTTIPTPP
ncbi:hypothetical protein [Xylophilus ampelinus]|uniref:hypothetical protein n=1 Tax=Xylophilus ampelinus TaxID=54067 RepID=UPI0011B37FE4|nr:hypothetical protein [Xylophilus ampelinus]MCS4510438.1 hypothetical protein [Xylophilus ampelinus]